MRVWNLGRLAAIGVRLRVYWANPSFSFDNPDLPPQYIGGMYLDLSDRYQSGSHIVSRLPSLWVPKNVNDGHGCLLAKVDSFADSTGSGFDANIDRHVGQRNLYLATQQEDLTSIIDSLGQTLPEGADVQMLYHIGGRFEMKSISHAEVSGSLGKAVMQRLNIPDLTAKTVIDAFHGGRADVEPLQFLAYQYTQDGQDVKIFGEYTIYLSNTETITKFFNRYTILPSYGTPSPPIIQQHQQITIRRNELYL